LFRRGGEDDEVGVYFESIALISLLEIYPEAIHDIDREGQTLLHRSLRHVWDEYILTHIIHTLLAAKTDLTEIVVVEVVSITEVVRNTKELWH
jgi:hypothetical protein